MMLRRQAPRFHALRQLCAVSALILGAFVMTPARADKKWAPRTITIEATPLPVFDVSPLSQARLGPLEYRGGLALQSKEARFGGFSGLAFDPATRQILALSDHGWWLRAQLISVDGKPAQLTNAMMAPILGPEGKPLGRTRRFDTESLALHEGVAWVAIERVHEVLRFEIGRDGLKARGQPVPLPRDAKTLPSNQSLEAICFAAHGPARGTLITLAERGRKGDDLPTRGWILQGAQKGSFDLARDDEFDVTDCAFTPKGDLIVLERRFSWFSGLAMRLRRIDPRSIKPNALLKGEVVMQAGSGTVADNMEGLAITKNEKGETILTLISDDNFSTMQRTVLLQFRLREE